MGPALHVEKADPTHIADWVLSEPSSEGQASGIRSMARLYHRLQGGYWEVAVKVDEALGPWALSAAQAAVI